MSDLVVRLRARGGLRNADILAEAADEIERLRKLIASKPTGHKTINYFSDGLRRHGAETRNEFYCEAADELERLAKEVDGYCAFARSVNEAVNSNIGYYKP